MNGDTDNAVRNTVVQVVHTHPILVIVVASATYTVTVVSNNLFSTHGGTGSGPGQQVVVITANTALVTLGTAARREQVIHLAPVKVGVPGDNIVI